MTTVQPARREPIFKMYIQQSEYVVHKLIKPRKVPKRPPRSKSKSLSEFSLLAPAANPKQVRHSLGAFALYSSLDSHFPRVYWIQRWECSRKSVAPMKRSVAVKLCTPR
jgi:hypothetical protein